MQGVYIIVDALVHVFDAVGDIDLAAQRLSFVPAGQRFQLGNQLAAFAQGKELAALHRVHQQLQLRQLEPPAGNVIAAVRRFAVFHIQPPLTQRLQIAVKAFALGGDAALRQIFGHLRNGNGVLLIAVLQQEVHQVQALQLLVGKTGHGHSSFTGYILPQGRQKHNGLEYDNRDSAGIDRTRRLW